MKKKILIIDDDEFVHQVLGTYLQQHGYQTMHAETGEEGSRIANEGAPDLVILDLLLHGQDGYETLESFHRRHPSVPVIVLTGLAGDQELNADVANLGAAICIRKTEPFPSILAVVKDLLPAESEPLQE